MAPQSIISIHQTSLNTLVIAALSLNSTSRTKIKILQESTKATSDVTSVERQTDGKEPTREESKEEKVRRKSELKNLHEWPGGLELLRRALLVLRGMSVLNSVTTATGKKKRHVSRELMIREERRSSGVYIYRRHGVNPLAVQ